MTYNALYVCSECVIMHYGNRFHGSVAKNSYFFSLSRHIILPRQLSWLKKLKLTAEWTNSLSTSAGQMWHPAGHPPSTDIKVVFVCDAKYFPHETSPTSSDSLHVRYLPPTFSFSLIINRNSHRWLCITENLVTASEQDKDQLHISRPVAMFNHA